MLEIELAETGNEVRMTLRGKATVVDAPALRLAIVGAVRRAGAGMTVDLAEVAFVDSSGIAVFVEGWKKAKDAGKAFVLVDPSPAVMRVLKLSQLHTIFDIRSSP